MISSSEGIQRNGKRKYYFIEINYRVISNKGQTHSRVYVHIYRAGNVVEFRIFFFSPLDGPRKSPLPPSPQWGGQSKWRKWEECWECLGVEAPPTHCLETEASSREEVAAMAPTGPLRWLHQRSLSTAKHDN